MRPDEDELALWLSGRLTARGYRVWADLELIMARLAKFGKTRVVALESHVDVAHIPKDDLSSGSWFKALKRDTLIESRGDFGDLL